MTPTVPKAALAARTAENQPLPWAPMAIFVWTILNGPLFGGIWAAINAKRLGLKDLIWPCLLMAAIAQAIPIALSNSSLGLIPSSPTDFSLKTFLRIGTAYYFLLAQREAFWEHEDGGGKKASYRIPVTLGIILFLIQVVFRGGA